MIHRTRKRGLSGLPPGTLVHVGPERTTPVKLQLIEYDEQHLEETEAASPEECFPFLDAPTHTWLNVTGVHQMDIIEKIGHYLHLHPLLLEDVVNTTQRPKLEDYEDHLFIVLKMLDYDEDANTIIVEQVSLVLGADYLISFLEDEGDVFDSVRTRLRSGTGRLRKYGVDYLAYALIDAIVDNYFVILEKMGDDIEEIEHDLVSTPDQETLEAIYVLKREMIALRRAVWPLREVIGFMERGESPLIQAHTLVYLRDVYDHTIQIIDTVESVRDLLSGMLDIYLSGVSNRMNEIVKVLTIFSTIFIPMTFFAGVYGMNFKYFPELDWKWAYLAFWIGMMVILALMLSYFKRKKWL